MFEQLLRTLAKKISKEHFPGVPDPESDAEALYRTVEALKIGYEQLVRTRGTVGKSALLVEELDDFAAVLLPILDERYATAVEETDESLSEHIANGDIHFPDAPADGPWGRSHGEWILLPQALPLDWRQIIDDNGKFLNKTWSSSKLDGLFNDLLDLINGHIGDKNNPHEVMHAQLTDVTEDQHHPKLHDLGSHTDVTMEVSNYKVGQGLWRAPDGSWRNRTAFLEAWPTGLVNGGELNIGPGVNDVEVIAGLGIISDAYTDPLAPPVVKGLEWNQINEAITAAPSAAGSVVWVSIYDTGVPAPVQVEDIGGTPINIGALHQFAQPPGPSLARMEVFLGVLVHNGVAWKEVSNPKVINQTAETLREVATTVLPLTSIIQGGTVSEQASFTLDQAAGTVWEQNRNWHVDKSDPNREALPAATPISFQYVSRDFGYVGSPTSTVDPAIWDDGTPPDAVSGSNNTTTIQRLYLDPANNYWMLLGQTEYPNFLTAQASLPADSVVVPFILQNSILLGYIVAEKGKTDWDVDEAVFISAGSGAAGSGGGGTPITDHDNLNGITPDNHHNQVHLLYGADHSDVNIVPTPLMRHLLQRNADTSKWEVDYRSKYIATYAEGPTYYPQEWVANQTYISIANTETTDPAFPVEVGELSPVYPEVPPFLEESNESLVRSGYLVTFTEAGEVRNVDVWIPEITPDTHYTLVVIRDPNGSPVLTRLALRNENLTAGQWNLVAADSVLHIVGSEVLIYLESQNYGASTPVTGGWNYGGQNNTGAPAVQGWNHNNAKTIVRIDKEDLDNVGRQTELMSMVAGTSIQFAESLNTANTQVYTVTVDPVDSNPGSPTLGYVEYGVSLTGETGTITLNAATTMDADVPVAQATKFVYEPNKFTGYPAWATVDSFLQYGDVDQPTTAGIGYGINFDFQQLSQSPDWNLIVVGGGGGGGGGDFTPTTFTGAGTSGYVPDPVTEAGTFLRDDGTWGSFVEDAEGRIGIGTTPSTAYKMTVQQSNFNLGSWFGFDGAGVYLGESFDTAGIVQARGKDGTGAPLYMQGTSFILQTTEGGTNDRININGLTGDVGIGVTNPSQRLHVAGSGIFEGASAALGINDFGASYFITAGTPATPFTAGVPLAISCLNTLTLSATGASGIVRLLTDGTEGLRVSPTGFVGLGNTNPFKALSFPNALATGITDANKISYYTDGTDPNTYGVGITAFTINYISPFNHQFVSGGVVRALINSNGLTLGDSLGAGAVYSTAAGLLTNTPQANVVTLLATEYQDILDRLDALEVFH